MDRLTPRKKAVLAITLIWVGLAAILLISIFTIGIHKPDTRPFFTTLVKIYTCLIPIVVAVMAIIRQKHVILNLIVCGITLLFCLYFLIFPLF